MMERNVQQTQQLMRKVRERAMAPIDRALATGRLSPAGGIVFAHPRAPSAVAKPPPSPPQPPKARPKPVPATPVPKPKSPRAAARDFSHLQGQTASFELLATPKPAAIEVDLSNAAARRIAGDVIAAYRATGRYGLKS